MLVQPACLNHHLEITQNWTPCLWVVPFVCKCVTFIWDSYGITPETRNATFFLRVITPTGTFLEAGGNYCLIHASSDVWMCSWVRMLCDDSDNRNVAICKVGFLNKICFIIYKTVWTDVY